MVIYDDEIPCVKHEPCECCGCEEETCCCDFLTEYESSYWQQKEGFTQSSFPLYLEIIDFQCNGSPGCGIAGTLNGKNVCLTASSEPDGSLYCGGKKWSNASFLNTGCSPGVQYQFTLRCAVVQNTTHADDVLSNCEGRRWVLALQQSNADCEDGDPGFLKYQGSYVNQTGQFEYCSTTYTPSCTNFNEDNPGQGRGEAEIYFILPAPYNDESRTTGNSCTCCDAPDKILIKITYNESSCTST